MTSKLSFDLEYSISGMTRDASSVEEDNLGDYSFSNNLEPFFTYGGTSSFSSAFKTGLSYHLKVAQFGFSYRRIDPNYESLGIPFINNDIEDITANISWRMFKNKVGITTSGGIQRNNLDDAKNASNKRIIGSINASYNVTKKWSLMANFSNFNTSVTKTRINGLDSLNYYQVSNNMTLATNYKLVATQYLVQSINASVNYQGVSDIENNNSIVKVANLGYTSSFPKIGLTTAISGNYNVNSFQGLDNPGFGATLTLSKALFKKKLRVNVSFSQLNFMNDGRVVDKTLGARTALAYIFKKKHNFSVNYNFIKKNSTIHPANFMESRVNFKYVFNFSSSKK